MLDAFRAPIALTLALVLAALAGCDTGNPPPAPVDGGLPSDGGDSTDAWMRTDVGVDAGPSCTTLLSHADTDIPLWPAMELLTDDPTTETGHRLVFDDATHPTIAMQLGGFRSTLTEDLQTVDGFGVNAEAIFRFARHFDETMLAARPLDENEGLGFVVVSPGPPRFVPALVTTTDEGATLVLAPLHPLPEQAEVAAFVSRDLADAARGCFETSTEMSALLATPDARSQAAIDALVSVGAITGASDLIGLVAYPTQSTTPDSIAVAADVRSRSFTWSEAPTCVDETNWRHCEGRFVAGDYRGDDGVLHRARGAAATPQRTYELPVSIWLPLDATGPVPMLVYGHGLGGGREQGEVLAGFAAPHGIATVAIDAQAHGEHPTATPGAATLTVVLQFFGIHLDMLQTRALEAARLRDNFRASTWDKLQLLSLLRSHPDVDGDGEPDLDTARFAYLGVSLGGIMGPELLALSGDLSAGVLVVPGGRVSAIISDSSTFSPLVLGVRPRGTTEGDVRRFFPILQTILDPGDAASYGGHILADRLPDAGGPQSTLLGVVLDDDTVPNVSNYTLARAFADLPIVEQELRPVPGLTSVAGPLVGNFSDGAGGHVTGGLLQFDVIGVPGGGTEMATHSNVGDSDVGASAWLDFLDTHFAGTGARIRDPYAALGLPHAM
ncbi:MAG: hypothetical protein U0234_05040 [Sandaracinus sp.]